MYLLSPSDCSNHHDEFQALPGGGAAVIYGDVAEADLHILDSLFQEYGEYRLTTEGAVLRPGMGIGEGIPVENYKVLAIDDDESFTRHRILNNPGTEMIFPPRVDISILAEQLHKEHGSIYGRPAISEDQRPTFRGLYTVIDKNGTIKKAEGAAKEELYIRAQEFMTNRFVPYAKRLFGTPIVVPKMLFANMLLPGQEISMHVDVPEFRGIHPKTCPNWMQCVMHGSGLFERWRILQAACVMYYQDMDCGSLAVYMGEKKDVGIVIPGRRGLGVIFEAESIPHHSDVFPARGQSPRKQWPKGVRLRYLSDTSQWAVMTSDGEELERYARNEVRVSTQMKLHCFRDAEEERKYFDHSDDITVEKAIEILKEDLRCRGRFFGATPAPAELAVMMIREYLRWPTPDAVRKCWQSYPDSVFHRALTEASSVTFEKSSQHSRL